MAKGVINLQKESGGVTKITSTDGIGITELVLPESGELVNKDYADLKVALTEFIGANQNLSTNGYQKLPGGLIIQWGTGNVSMAGSTGQAINLPIAFPNGFLKAFASNRSGGGLSGVSSGASEESLSQVRLYTSSSGSNVTYFAIGC